MLEQNRGRWDQLLIQRGFAALMRAEVVGGALGPYRLQAAIAACHAQARTAEETDWERIAALYDALAQLTSSPVVELNRAVAVAMAFGPKPVSKLSIPCALNLRLNPITCCPSCAEICLQSSGVLTKPARNSNLQPLSHGIRESGNYFWNTRAAYIRG